MLTPRKKTDIFTKPLDFELFGYLRYKINGWWVKGILIWEEVWDYAHEADISTVIVKYLTKKPDLGNHDWFVIAIHDSISRPKSVRAVKKAVKFQGLVMDVNP